jgi:hypothetical protein
MHLNSQPPMSRAHCDSPQQSFVFFFVEQAGQSVRSNRSSVRGIHRRSRPWPCAHCCMSKYMSPTLPLSSAYHLHIRTSSSTHYGQCPNKVPASHHSYWPVCSWVQACHST